MTRKRNDAHSTEFGLWLREQAAIDSSLGYVATNIDYLWMNYKNGSWMLIEEKRHNRTVAFAQQNMFRILDNACKSDSSYKGFYILRFENTSPEDGTMTLNGIEITNKQLLSFLKFEQIGKVAWLKDGC